MKLGFAPTRRIFSVRRMHSKYAGLIRKRLEELNVDVVDIEDINDEGLLYRDEDLERIEH